MTTMSKYAEVQRFQSDLEQCMKCGFYTFWCPVYQEEKLESSVEVRGKKVTWHEPCHLNRHLGIKDQPRTDIKVNTGYSIR